jgi:hypothetical protein
MLVALVNSLRKPVDRAPAPRAWFPSDYTKLRGEGNGRVPRQYNAAGQPREQQQVSASTLFD